MGNGRVFCIGPSEDRDSDGQLGARRPEGLLPPRGPAQVAVFDATARKLRWTYDLSRHHPGLEPNDFWTTIDRSHMAVAGRWA